jgi:hypothetical protein
MRGRFRILWQVALVVRGFWLGSVTPTIGKSEDKEDEDDDSEGDGSKVRERESPLVVRGWLPISCSPVVVWPWSGVELDLSPRFESPNRPEDAK